MRVDAFQYELPADLIAQRPAERRGGARMLCLGAHGTVDERPVSDLADLLPEGTLVVVNDTRVVPARLLGKKRETGGRVEILLVRRIGPMTLDDVPESPGSAGNAEKWRALGKASKSLRFGGDVEVCPRGAERRPPVLFVRLLGRSPEDGLLEVALYAAPGHTVDDAIRASGHVPLPPYIKRHDEADDADRYQTVYARHDGAVAAPTAGLHLTTDALARMAARGCEVASVTLHVGLGTFRPVEVDDLNDHPMHAEWITVGPGTADAVARARARGSPVFAVGTTTVRALESAADGARRGHVRPVNEDTRLLIQPGYDWQIADGLLTNFHLPRSTLLALVCAFGGTTAVLDGYRLAVQRAFRFFSYGDAMLLWRNNA